MTVLIVDDEVFMVDYIKGLIDWQAYGFDCILTANSGSLARDYIKEHQPQLLITDIKMPKVSGLELASMIDDNKYGTKVIIMSGYSDFTYAKQALRYGVSEYLVKPVLQEEFVETLERILQCPNFKNDKESDNGTKAGYMTGDKRAIITCVKKYINENFDQCLSLDVLGEVVHLHPAYLSKIFKEATEVNLSRYVTDIRMERAAELLDQTCMKVHEVMQKTGYQKSQHFSKLFKERYGITPQEYRRRIRQ